MKYSSSQLHFQTANILDRSLSRPVVITKYSKDTYVLLSHKEFKKMKDKIKELKVKIRESVS